MNTENHNTEYKRIWKDDYIKWVCGFANADGGKIYIGIDDNMAVSTTYTNNWRIFPTRL